MSRTKSTQLLCALSGVALLLGIGSSAVAQELPPTLRDVVFGARHHAITDVTLNGVPFHAMAKGGTQPYLLWPRDGAVLGLEKELDVVEDWLERSSALLGHADFELRSQERWNWRGNEVWDYELVHADVPLHEARVMVHWQGDVLIGIVNHVPRGLERRDGPIARDATTVYWPRRTPDGHQAVLATVESEQLTHHLRTTFTLPDGQQFQSWSQSQRSPSQNAHQKFKEWQVPRGTFPDQIHFDSKGKIWFSQPNDNWVTQFDPATETFTQISTKQGSGPDGLFVDSNDRVWTGQYFSQHLGRWNPNNQTYRNFDMPYSPANPAIPVENTLSGTIWVTDHQNNKISEWDINSKTWLQTLDMPTAACWVVQGYMQQGTGDLYFTEYFADQIGFLDFGARRVVDLPVGTGGPAFGGLRANTFYYSNWNEATLGEYNINDGTWAEYTFPVAGEWGGPMWMTPDGRAVVGTRNVGYVMVFDPITKLFTDYQIPSSGSGLKDGLTVAPDGTVWLTETGGNKIARLYID